MTLGIRQLLCNWAASAFCIDLRVLAALRVSLALLILVDPADRSRDLAAHYTDGGVWPRSALDFDALSSGAFAELVRLPEWSLLEWLFYPLRGLLSVHFLSGTASGQLALFGIAGRIAATTQLTESIGLDSLGLG
jgi:hypothetical protein